MDTTPGPEESGSAGQSPGAPGAPPDHAHGGTTPDGTAKPTGTAKLTDSSAPVSAETAQPSTAQPSTGECGTGDSTGDGDAGSTRRVLTTIAVLLTIGSAATDVMTFTRLGSVFASVMTSNIVFLGLAAARHSATLAEHAAVSFAGYVIGVAGGSRLARARARGRSDGAATGSRRRPWSPGIASTLVVETAVLVGFTIGWELAGAKPTGGAQFLLIGLATIAMGMQSAVVTVMGFAGVSTTYLTGTLTMLIDAIASPRPDQGANARSVAALCALVTGALLSGLLLATAPAATPAIPLAMLVSVIGTGTVWLRPGRRP